MRTGSLGNLRRTNSEPFHKIRARTSDNDFNLRELENQDQRPRRYSDTDAYGKKGATHKLTYHRFLPPIESPQILRDLPQPHSLRALAAKSLLTEMREEVGRVFYCINRGDTITSEHFERILELLQNIIEIHESLAPSALAELGLPCKGRPVRLMRQLFSQVCREYVQQSLDVEQRRQLSKQACRAKFKYKYSTNRKGGLREREIQKVYSGCIRKLRKFAIFGRFYEISKTKVASLSNGQLIAIHDDINNSLDAIDFTRDLSLCPQASRSYLKWMSFVTVINNAVMDNGELIVRRLFAARTGNNPVPSDKECRKSMVKMFSYNSDYYDYSHLECVVTLRERAVQLIRILTMSNHLVSSLKFLSIRGWFNVVRIIDQQCDLISKGKGNSDYLCLWPLVKEDVESEVLSILKKRAVTYSKRAKELDEAMSSLEESTTLVNDIDKWKRLFAAYKNLAKAHVRCDIAGVEKLWRIYRKSEGYVHETQISALLVVEEQLGLAMQTAAHMEERISNLFFLLSTTQYVESFNPFHIVDRFEDFYFIHRMGRAIGFSTALIDTHLLLACLEIKFQSSGNLKDDIDQWKRIHGLLKTLLSTKIPVLEGQDSEERDVAVILHAERCERFREMIRRLYLKHSAAYNETLDPKGFGDDFRNLAFLEELGREAGFTITAIDYIRLAGCISSFKTSGSLERDMPKWNQILDLYSNLAEVLAVDDQRIKESKEAIAELFNSHARMYSRKFNAAEFIPNSKRLERLLRIGHDIGLDIHSITAQYRQLPPFIGEAGLESDDGEAANVSGVRGTYQQTRRSDERGGIGGGMVSRETTLKGKEKEKEPSKDRREGA